LWRRIRRLLVRFRSHKVAALCSDSCDGHRPPLQEELSASRLTQEFFDSQSSAAPLS
jgi:hypothetical protein